MNYTTEDIKILREKTGAGVSACKNALIKTNGDINLAINILYQEGLIIANKKINRPTIQGFISSYIHTGGKIGVLIELNCETDFVAKRIEFQTLAKNLAMQIASFSEFQYISFDHIPESVINSELELLTNLEENEKKKMILTKFSSHILLNQPYIYNTNITVEDNIKAHIALLGENIQIGKVCKFKIGD